MLDALPRAWRLAADSTFAPGRASQGGGGTPEAEQNKVAESPARPDDPAWSVRELGRLLAATPIVCRYADDGIWIKAVKRFQDGKWARMDDGSLIPDPSWEMTHWDMMREASRLFWHDAAVHEFLETHPDARTGISGRNFWAGMNRK